MSFYVTGDTHGNHDIAKFSSERFNARTTKLTSNDYAMICGDFGAIWSGDYFDKVILRYWNEKPYNILFVDGNHENHNLLDSMPIETWNGGKVHKICDNVYHLMRGQIFTIDDKKIFTFGGASSHDKKYRTENLSWWTRELPSETEINEAIENLDKVNWKVDYIFTHCCGNGIQNHIDQDGIYETDLLTDFLDKVYLKAEFKDWYCGHYHRNKDIENIHILYNEIRKIW